VSFYDGVRLLNAQSPLLLGKVSLPRSVTRVLGGVDPVEGRHAKGANKSARNLRLRPALCARLNRTEMIEWLGKPAEEPIGGSKQGSCGIIEG